MKRIAILGEIGSGNLGDDYGYILLSRELRAAFAELDILADIRPLTPNLFWLLAGYHWDAVLSGVGTLLDMCNGGYVKTLRDAAGKCPVAVLGSGINDLRHMTATNEGRAAFADLALKARYMWVRKAPDGYEEAMSGPDPMWLHGWHWTPAERPFVGLNIGYAGFSLLNLDPEYLTVVREARPMLHSKARLLAAWNDDHAWLNRIERLEDEITTVTGTKASLAALDTCSAVLATRIHLAVLAACHGCYPILPDYAGKVREVFGGTNVDYLAMPLESSPHDVARELNAPRKAIRNKPEVEAAQLECRARVRKAAKAIAGAW